MIDRDPIKKALLHKQQPQNKKKRKHMDGKRTRENKKRIRERI